MQPTAQLMDYVQVIWAMESEEENEAYPRALIMPDGLVEIVFHYRDPFTTYQNFTTVKQPLCFAVSMMTTHVEIESAGKTGFISVRCFPWGAYHFFDVPVREFLDQMIDAKRLWGDSVDHVIQALKTQISMADRFRIVEEFLGKCLLQYQKPERVVHVIKLIRDTKGQLSIDELSEQTGISKKQLERKFLMTVGTTPKIFSRMTRFLNICNHMEEYQARTLTQLSYACGYYDQAHFVKDFKAFSGLTPTEFLSKERVFHSTL